MTKNAEMTGASQMVSLKQLKYSNIKGKYGIPVADELILNLELHLLSILFSQKVFLLPKYFTLKPYSRLLQICEQPFYYLFICMKLLDIEHTAGYRADIVDMVIISTVGSM